jgi:hypothetical protein
VVTLDGVARSSPVMPRESGASSHHCESYGYWIARFPRAMTTEGTIQPKIIAL